MVCVLDPLLHLDQKECSQYSRIAEPWGSSIEEYLRALDGVIKRSVTTGDTCVIATMVEIGFPVVDQRVITIWSEYTARHTDNKHSIIHLAEKVLSALAGLEGRLLTHPHQKSKIRTYIGAVKWIKVCLYIIIEDANKP